MRPSIAKLINYTPTQSNPAQPTQPKYIQPNPTPPRSTNPTQILEYSVYTLKKDERLVRVLSRSLYIVYW